MNVIRAMPVISATGVTTGSLPRVCGASPVRSVTRIPAFTATAFQKAGCLSVPAPKVTQAIPVRTVPMAGPGTACAVFRPAATRAIRIPAAAKISIETSVWLTVLLRCAFATTDTFLLTVGVSRAPVILATRIPVPLMKTVRCAYRMVPAVSRACAMTITGWIRQIIVSQIPAALRPGRAM